MKKSKILYGTNTNLLAPQIKGEARSKKHFIIMPVLMLLFSLSSFITVKAQNFPIYPIPSYNVTVNGGAGFMNQFCPSQINNKKEKRDIHIHLVSSLGPGMPCRVSIWVYTLDMTTILGPYGASCDETLTVPIDNRDWGVFIESTVDVLTDVWISVQ